MPSAQWEVAKVTTETNHNADAFPDSFTAKANPRALVTA